MSYTYAQIRMTLDMKGKCNTCDDSPSSMEKLMWLNSLSKNNDPCSIKHLHDRV